MASSAVTPAVTVMTDQPVVDAINAIKTDIGALQLGSASGPVDVTTATLAVTAASHSSRAVLLDRAAGVTATLPASTGLGARFRFIVKTTASGGSYIVKVANVSDAFVGFSAVVGAANAENGFIASANSDDTVTLNGTTTGGFAGDVIEFEDIFLNVWSVRVFGKATGTVATPFSATV